MDRTSKTRMLAGMAAFLLAGPAVAGDVKLASPTANQCTGSGANAHCSVGNRPLATEDGGAAWAITNIGPSDLRFEVRSGDTAPWDASHGHKAERAEISDPKHLEPLDTDIWFSMGLMVEPGAKVTSHWAELGQLHPTSDPGDISPSPAWAQELQAGDRFAILIRTSAQKPLRTSPAPRTLFVDPAFQRGRVYHLVYRLRYSQTDGLLQAWRDGRQIVNYSGPLGFVDQQGPYFKFGIYREPAPETLAVHFDDLRFGGPELKPGS